MSGQQGLRPSSDIHAYLVEQLNLTLRRPGMYGGESAVRLVIDHLAFVEDLDGVWSAHRDAMEARGSFTVTGVMGAFARLIPKAYEYGMASVYAEFARDRGWLRTERVLGGDEYARMSRTLAGWVEQDRRLADVLDTFGDPSVVFGGSNPRYGKTLGYVSGDLADPMVSFHLWNGVDPQVDGAWPTYDEPILIAARRGSGRFDQTFAFTPTGKRLRPIDDRPSG
ncbi:hypothetical protein [Spirillospora sp. NPDC029432]|uniref:hypothetical protein n=1 Tax=Spirillospora sp. NPDC029432 TaxID=3154599 RepID=UPI00345202BB